MPIKALTIDFWNTLFDSSGGQLRNSYRQRALIREMDKIGLLIKRRQFENAMQASWKYFDKIWKNDLRTPSPRETVEFFWNYLKIPYDRDSIDTIIREFAECVVVHPPKLLPGVEDALSKLALNYKLGIVSDTGFTPGKTLRRLIDSVGALEYFDAYSFSDETGVSKPHEMAFMTALNEMKCRPEEALHIGDIEQTDIAGAKKIGMKAILFNGDSTAVYKKPSSGETAADFKTDSWAEIVPMIEEEVVKSSA